MILVRESRHGLFRPILKSMSRSQYAKVAICVLAIVGCGCTAGRPSRSVTSPCVADSEFMLGGVRHGTTVDILLTKLGLPDSINAFPFENDTVLYFTSLRVGVSGGKAYSVFARDSSVYLPNGIRLGSSLRTCITKIPSVGSVLTESDSLPMEIQSVNCAYEVYLILGVGADSLVNKLGIAVDRP